MNEDAQKHWDKVYVCYVYFWYSKIATQKPKGYWIHCRCFPNNYILVPWKSCYFLLYFILFSTFENLCTLCTWSPAIFRYNFFFSFVVSNGMIFLVFFYLFIHTFLTLRHAAMCLQKVLFVVFFSALFLLFFCSPSHFGQTICIEPSIWFMLRC